MGALSCWLLCSFDSSPSFFEHKIVQAHLVLPLLQPWYQPFVQGALVPISGKWCFETSIWAQGMVIASGVSSLLGPPTLGSTREYMHVLMYTCMHSFASLLNENHVFIAIPQDKDRVTIFPFNVCNSLFWWWETWFPLLLIFSLNQSIPLHVSNLLFLPSPPPLLRHSPLPTHVLIPHSRPPPRGHVPSPT